MLVGWFDTLKHHVERFKLILTTCAGQTTHVMIRYITLMLSHVSHAMETNVLFEQWERGSFLYLCMAHSVCKHGRVYHRTPAILHHGTLIHRGNIKGKKWKAGEMWSGNEMQQIIFSLIQLVSEGSRLRITCAAPRQVGFAQFYIFCL